MHRSGNQSRRGEGPIGRGSRRERGKGAASARSPARSWVTLSAIEVALDGVEKAAEGLVDFLQLRLGDRRQQIVRAREEELEGLLFDLDPRGGEGDEGAAPVLGIGSAFDEAQTLEPLEHLGHASRRSLEIGVELARRQLVRRPRTAESRENGVVIGGQVVGLQGLPLESFDQNAQTSQPRDQKEAGGIRRRIISRPGFRKFIDPVHWPAAGSVPIGAMGRDGE